MSWRSALFLILLALAWAVWMTRSDDGAPTNGAVGKKAPSFSLQDETGKKITLDELREKVVLVHFWATWCGPCAEELPTLDVFQKKMADEPFALVAISEDEGHNDVELFKKKVPFSFPFYLDVEQETADAYGTHRLPETYLVDKQGIIVKKFSGPQNWTDSKWEKAIRDMF